MFGEYEPKDLIHLDDAKMDEKHRKFLYEFAVWIHRAIVVSQRLAREERNRSPPPNSRRGQGLAQEKEQHAP